MSTSRSTPVPLDPAKLRHDLRTPINHILGYGELLREDLADQGIRKLEDLDKMCLAARQMLEIVEGTAGVPRNASKEPCVAKTPGPEGPPPETDEGDAVLAASVRGRILIVDDNAGNRETLARRLVREGHSMGEAANGQQALAALADGGYDLVLLDVMMPVMDGPAALTRMKSDPALRDIPVIMISALDELTSVIRCIEAGAEDYLPKPFEPTLLRARIGACLEKKALRDQERAHLRVIEETQARLEQELAEAARYVSSLLPPETDTPARVRWCFAPSTELGGDSFGYHWIDDTRYAIYLLDVCGHGVGAALLSVAASNVLHTRSLPSTDFLSPASVLTSLNRTFQMEEHNNMYFTIWYGVFDVVSRILLHASGGHPPAILLAPDTLPLEVAKSNPLIGVMPEAAYEQESLTIPPSTRLVVFSDGAYELKRPQGTMTAFEDFLSWIGEHAHSETLPQDALAWAREITGQKVLEDDLSLLCIDLPDRPPRSS